MSKVPKSNKPSLIKCYHVKHRRDFTDQLKKAKKVADYAVKHKNKLKLLTTKYVKDIGLPNFEEIRKGDY